MDQPAHTVLLRFFFAAFFAFFFLWAWHTPAYAAPANPSTLAVVSSCSASGVPTVTFTFRDNSNSEDLFWLDVNGAVWTGSSTPSPWGVKTISRTSAQKSATGGTVTFVWDNTSLLDAGGDVDPLLAGNQLAPSGAKTYWWRVRAHSNTSGDSSHVYPPNTTTAPGASFTTQSCLPDLAVRNSTDGASPVVTVTGGGATLSGNTIDVVQNSTFTIAFNSRNVGTWPTAVNSRTVAENFAGAVNSYNQWTVGNLAANTSLAHSFSTYYATTGSKAILLRVDADGNVAEGGGETNNDVNLTVNVTEAVPANPSNLSVSTSCNNGSAEVQFTFTDNSTNEDLFWLDVNGAQWSGASSPIPWGYKNIGRTVGEIGGVGPVTFLWTGTQTMDAGDVDPVAAGSQLTPAENKTYWWRAKAGNGTVGDSAHVYPLNTTTLPGGSFTTPDCPDTPYDLSASIIPNSWRNNVGVMTQTFEPGSNATLKVEVKNNSAAASPATKLYFYYNSLGPDCPPGASTPPKDGANIDQSYNVASIGPGGVVEVNVTFAVGSAETTATAYAFVVPSCSFLPSPGVDPTFGNNRSGGFSYTVSTDKFFETRGGDVGAAGTVQVGFDSSTITSPGPQYQSDYIIAAQNVDSRVSSKNNQILNSYVKPQVPGGGVYDYLYARIKAANHDENCGMGIGSGLVKICDAAERVFSTTGPTPDALPSGDFVMVVLGNLRIADNVILPNAQSTATFIVAGNITVELDVTRMDGVYIAKKGFADSEILNAGIGPTDALTVNGALYVDCEEGGIVSLQRYFAPPWTINNIYPSNVFKFEPKYLMKLQSLIGVSPIVWREVVP